MDQIEEVLHQEREKFKREIAFLRLENKKLQDYKELSLLQDKLLISYRVGKNPETVIDKMQVIRKRIEKH